MHLKLPPYWILLILVALFFSALFVFVRGIVYENFTWCFWLSCIYFGIGSIGFFSLLLSVDNNLRFQRKSGISLDKDGNLEFKRMKQFSKFLQISDDQLARDFAMINSKLKKKATAKDLMNSIAILMIRDNITYQAIISDFSKKKPESLKDYKFQLTLCKVTKQ